MNVPNYARWNKGNLRVYYVYNKVILTSTGKDALFLPMSDGAISDIDDYGFFPFWFMGHYFLLEIIPSKAQLADFLYLQKNANQLIIPATGEERLMELTDIRQVDFFMERFGKKHIDVNEKLNR